MFRDFWYVRDAGCNREYKVDNANQRRTQYAYDLSNNRLEWYHTVADATGYVSERVEYEYEHDGDAAGNVRRVVRKVPDPPQDVPDEWFVYATEFFYNNAGEVQVISQRQWHEAQGVVNPLTLMTTSIREFRGNGRTRYMMRDRIINPGQPDDLMPNYDTGTWTSYDGDLPTKDLTLTWTTTPAPAHYVGSNVVRYHLGLAQFTPDPATPELNDFAVKYFHADHLGTTRAMTNDPDDSTGPPFTPPTPSPRITHTAFGEQVSLNGTATTVPPSDTRYQYVGQHGYETFADIGTGASGGAIASPFLHVGARWHDPSTGRFLQRDPIGVDGGLNVYEYAESQPCSVIDPLGLFTVPGYDNLEGAPWNPQRIPEGGFGREKTWADTVVSLTDWLDSPATGYVETGANVASLLGPAAAARVATYGGTALRAFKANCGPIGRQLQRVRQFVRWDRGHHGKPPQWDGWLPNAIRDLFEL
ncbi:MAG: RHS repeat-associated core domain-containing protein [Phycisphaerales bacterium]|nr:RHS repeat-associated core domain-containing protein [Phycisphaerales bacterium]